MQTQLLFLEYRQFYKPTLAGTNERSMAVATVNVGTVHVHCSLKKGTKSKQHKQLF